MGTLLLGLMLFFLAANPRTGANPDGKGRVEDKVAVEEHTQKPNEKKAPVEWFPDPDRGWIRLQERDRGQSDNARDRNDHSRVKNENNRTRWEY
jgi:hypothetical protein